MSVYELRREVQARIEDLAMSGFVTRFRKQELFNIQLYGDEKDIDEAITYINAWMRRSGVDNYVLKDLKDISSMLTKLKQAIRVGDDMKFKDSMKILISERISERKMKTPEGYLICIDAIIARTGHQTYDASELGKGGTGDIQINRHSEDVFSKETLASFENKPITIDHPSEQVNPENFNRLSVGYVRDVKKGVADNQDVILATLVITDSEGIEKVDSGELTNLSCGYDADIVEDGNEFKMINIRGNHVALCEVPRAGITRIVDSVIEDSNYTITIDKFHKSEVIVPDLARKYNLKYDNYGYVITLTGRWNNLVSFVINARLVQAGKAHTYVKERIDDSVNKKSEEMKDSNIRMWIDWDNFQIRYGDIQRLARRHNVNARVLRGDRYVLSGNKSALVNFLRGIGETTDDAIDAIIANKIEDSIDDKLQEIEDSLRPGEIHMKDFNPERLVKAVQTRRQSLHNEAVTSDGTRYVIFVHPDFGSLVSDTQLEGYVSIVKVEAGNRQSRVLGKDFGNPQEAIRILTDWRRGIRDSIEDGINDNSRLQVEGAWSKIKREFGRGATLDNDELEQLFKEKGINLPLNQIVKILVEEGAASVHNRGIKIDSKNK